ncbi:unnamed protein product [Closterium sp. NIES-65]|nr:unnamed protein product [Closterium sp. NIES-65]
MSKNSGIRESRATDISLLAPAVSQPSPPSPSPSQPQVFPLLFIIILIVWEAMNMQVDTFAAMDIFPTEVFPLLFIIILIVWVTMNMLADTFAAMDIFLIEVQLLAMVANFNLNFPASWVKTVVLLYNIAAFDPVSFPAVVTVSGSQRWVKSRLS